MMPNPASLGPRNLQYILLQNFAVKHLTIGDIPNQIKNK